MEKELQYLNEIQGPETRRLSKASHHFSLTKFNHNLKGTFVLEPNFLNYFIFLFSVSN